MARVVPVAGAKLPTKGNLRFGVQRTPTHRHNGIDLPAKEGTPVLAAADGQVEWATWAWRSGFSGYGRVVVVRHADGERTLYAHLKRPLVSAGTPVRAGDPIGEVGITTYYRTDPTSSFASKARAHLHFEVSAQPYPQSSGAQRLDPVAWLRADPPVAPSTPDGSEPVARAPSDGGSAGAAGAAVAGAMLVALLLLA